MTGRRNPVLPASDGKVVLGPPFLRNISANAGLEKSLSAMRWVDSLASGTVIDHQQRERTVTRRLIDNHFEPDGLAVFQQRRVDHHRPGEFLAGSDQSRKLDLHHVGLSAALFAPT
jgi:hypothetical protein